MLIVQDITQTFSSMINLEDLTLDVSWEKGDSYVPIYWRSGNFTNTLIEIGMHEKNGRLISFNLIVVDSMLSYSQKPNLAEWENAPTKYGIPICDISRWKLDDSYQSHFIDEPEKVIAYIGSHQYSILFGDVSSIQYWIYADKARFGIDNKSQIRIVEFTELSDVEIEKLKMIFHYQSD